MGDPSSDEKNAKAKLIAIILAACEELSPTLAKPIDLSAGAQSPLYGPEGSLDSLALVSLIIGVEQTIQDEFNVTIGLADERAMSRKNSPFKTVNSLADYAAGLLAEAPSSEEQSIG